MLFLVPHLFPSARFLDAAASDLHLPALQTLLARGRRTPCPADGIEAALCAALGIARQQDWPLAPITLAADGGSPGDAYWLRADPVHLRLMRDRIALADGTASALAAEEANALVAVVAAHFGDQFAPLPLHPQRWYLRLAEAPRLTTTPRSIATGRDVDPLLPRGEDAMRFRTLLNELQMLLHEHPVNQAREARGEPPVNSLWLWGGGTLPPAPDARRVVYTGNAEAIAVAAFCHATVEPIPRQLAPAQLAANALTLLDGLVSAGQAGDPFGWRAAIQAMEIGWFRPLLSSLRRSVTQEIRLLDPVSGNELRVRGANTWKFWRRRAELVSTLA